MTIAARAPTGDAALTQVSRVAAATEAVSTIQWTIVAGRDGALWFTNDRFTPSAGGNHSIGRITTAGKITLYRHESIDSPHGITAGPDGALWFTNSGGDTIGRARIMPSR